MLQPPSSNVLFSLPSEAERSAAISEGLEGPVLGGHFVFYQGQYRELPVIELPNELLAYRADNGRLMLELLQLQKSRGLDKYFFHDNQDDATVQQDLHSLLLTLSKDSNGPIFQELKRQKQQTDPLLITAHGVIVNGNRRLAAMRQLLQEAPDSFRKFSRVRVAVLPREAQPQDIEYVEAALQLAPETKLAYSWINRRLKLRHQKYELKLPLPQLLESYRLQSAKEVVCELEELKLAETYLQDYCCEPMQYAEILDAEALFVKLNASLNKIAVAKRTLWQLLGFAMILSRNELKVKLVGYFPFTPPQPAFAPDLALFELARSEGLLQGEQSRDADPLPARAEKLLSGLLRQRGDAGRLSQEIVNILDQIRIDHNKNETPQIMLRNIQNARQLAERIEAGVLTKQQRAELGSELAAFTHHSKRLLETGAGAPPPLSVRQRRLRKLREDPYAYFADSRYWFLRKLKVFCKPKNNSLG